ncbi:cation-translocating P-type ATPase [Parenemella sanctibonifatiensis]|uniref:cation-translocating P-type ATPase n=1 Tax=Parenemella sanctibonifatiensis TaxID=2016505 RepID=UPI001E4F1439|nr:cation-translocating P-type ATPase [Parenemella sanctibonifatiensis]
MEEQTRTSEITPADGSDTERHAVLTPAAEVAADLGVNPDTGLSQHEARRRLAAHGPNELVGTAAAPAWLRFLAQFKDPLVFLLLIAIAISLIAWIIEGAHGVPIDAVVIGAIVVLNAIVGYIQENRAADAVAALQNMAAATATVLRDGSRTTIPATDVVVGDILILGEGDAVAADARLGHAEGLRVQESALTGEAESVDKDNRTLSELSGIGDRTNMVFKGTAVSQGTGRAIVVATGMDTEMGAIATMLDSTVSEPSPLEKEISSVSKMLGILVIGIAVVTMLVLFVVNNVSTVAEAVEVLLLGVSLAVAAVPEGLPAILTVVLAIGVQKLAEHRAVVTELHSVETLGSASVICSDKTGTLTRNEMTIQRIVTSSGSVSVAGIGYAPEGEVLDEATGQAPTGALYFESRRLLVEASLANDADLQQADDGSWQIIGDPTEASFLVALRKLEGAADRAADFERRNSVPFNSDRKMMSVLQADRAADGNLKVMAKGAPDVLLGRCVKIQVGEKVMDLDDRRRAEVLQTVEDLSGQAYRTMGVAWREITPQDADPFDEEDESDLVYVGTVGIIDPPRDEAASAVAEAHRAGVRTIMITGDHPTTASRIAADLGITDGVHPAVTGAALQAMDEASLIETVKDNSVYARVAPEHKLRIVNALQHDGSVVAMTGDGVNDAPALKTADIGVAMGITGTEVTKQAARMILGDDNFATIVTAIRQGRSIFANIKKFLRYLLSSNVGEVITVFFGVLLAGVIGLSQASPGAEMVIPLLATQILWINLVTDTGPALAMGVDPEVDDPMALPPRDQSERIIDRQMWSGIVLIGLVMGAITLATMDIFLPGGLIPGGTDDLETARTAAFTTLVFAQLFNALNSRSETTSAFHRLFSNRWLWGSVALAVVLQVAVVEVPFLQTAFGTTSLDLAHWAIAVGMSSLVLWVDEIRKVVLRRRVGSVAA